MTFHPGITKAWAAVAGTAGDACEPRWFLEDEGSLLVEGISTGWCTQLRLLAPALIKKLNAELPDGPTVKAILVRIRHVRVVVTGSRYWTDAPAIEDALLDAWHDAVQLYSPAVRFVVVHGDCPAGADRIAKEWAIANGVDHEAHPADWEAPCAEGCPGAPHRKTSRQHGDYCPLAGFRRNQLMVHLGADLLLGFRLNGSAGTSDCINRAEKAGIPVRVADVVQGTTVPGRRREHRR